MAIKAKQEEGESVGSLIYRFNRKVKQSGILREFRNRRFRIRPVNRNRRRASALRRVEKREQIEQARKLGKL
jgi:ribosomal protein S21